MSIRKRSKLEIFFYLLVLLPFVAGYASLQYSYLTAPEPCRAYEPAPHIAQSIWDAHAAWLGHAQVQRALTPHVFRGDFLLAKDSPAKQDLIQRFGLQPQPAAGAALPPRLRFFKRDLDGATVYGTDKDFQADIPLEKSGDSLCSHACFRIRLLELRSGETVVLLEDAAQEGGHTLVEPVSPDEVKCQMELDNACAHGFRDGHGAGTHHIFMGKDLYKFPADFTLNILVCVFFGCTQLLLFGWPGSNSAWALWFALPAFVSLALIWNPYIPGISFLYSLLLLVPAAILMLIRQGIRNRKARKQTSNA